MIRGAEDLQLWLHETITETLGYRKLSARWVPRQLTDQHKLNRVEAGQEFLRHYKFHGDEFLRARLLSLYLPEATHGWKKVFNEQGGEGGCGEMDEGVVGNYFEEGIKKLISQFTTCIEKNGDCRKIA